MRSPERIAGTVAHILREPKDSVAMCAHAREFARTRFGERSAIEAYVEYYQDILGTDR